VNASSESLLRSGRHRPGAIEMPNPAKRNAASKSLPNES
jgi:hypothetical protein